MDKTIGGSPTSGDYAWAQAEENANKLKKLDIDNILKVISKISEMEHKLNFLKREHDILRKEVYRLRHK